MWYLYSETPLQNLTFQYMPTQRLNTEKDKDILTCLMQVINSTGTYQYIIGTILFLFKLGQPGQRRQLQSSISSHGGCPKSTYCGSVLLCVLKVPYIPRNYEQSFWSKPVEAHTSHPSTLYWLNICSQRRLTSWIDGQEKERAQGTLKGFPGADGHTQSSSSILKTRNFDLWIHLIYAYQK